MLAQSPLASPRLLEYVVHSVSMAVNRVAAAGRTMLLAGGGGGDRSVGRRVVQFAAASTSSSSSSTTSPNSGKALYYMVAAASAALATAAAAAVAVSGWNQRRRRRLLAQQLITTPDYGNLQVSPLFSWSVLVLQDLASVKSFSSVKAEAEKIARVKDPTERLKLELNPGELRFRKFASVDFEGEAYMTPRDFLDSLIQDRPRPRIKSKVILYCIKKLCDGDRNTDVKE